MEYLNADQIRRFMLFSKAYEQVENKFADTPKSHQYYEKWFMVWERTYGCLPDDVYFFKIKKLIEVDFSRKSNYIQVGGEVSKYRKMDLDDILDLAGTEIPHDDQLITDNIIKTINKHLTKKQRRILERSIKGYTMVDIAKELKISKQAVKNQLTRIQKVAMEVSNEAESF